MFFNPIVIISNIWNIYSVKFRKKSFTNPIAKTQGEIKKTP